MTTPCPDTILKDRSNLPSCDMQECCGCDRCDFMAVLEELKHNVYYMAIVMVLLTIASIKQLY